MAHIYSDMSVRQVRAITVVEFLDRRLIDSAQIERLGQQILDMVKAATVPKFIISFAKVEYLSSTALNILIQIENAINKKKGQLRLAELDLELQKVFTIMKLHKVMKICPTTQDAVDSIEA